MLRAYQFLMSTSQRSHTFFFYFPALQMTYTSNHVAMLSQQ